MTNITLALNEEKPYYIQIYQYIAEQTNEGFLKGGEKLPSKRALALHLGVSVNTVVNAYNLLLEEGYIESIEKRGYFIVEQPVLTLSKKSVHKEEETASTFCYDFTTQNVSTNGFSFTSFCKCAKEVLSEQHFLTKSPLFGLLSLRQAIALHLLENRGISVHPEQIVIGNGLEMISSLFPFLGASYAIENPGYHKLALLRQFQDIEYCPIDTQGVTIPKKSDVLYTTSFNQFPTGIKMSIKRKKELVAWLKEKPSRYIIEDDFDAEFRLSGSPTTSLFSLAPVQVLFFSTFSTTLFPGFRISYIILPQKLQNAYKTLYEGHSCPVSTLDQEILCRYLESGEYARHINRLKKKYRRRRNRILLELKQDEVLQADPKRNYLSVLVRIQKKIDCGVLVKELQKEHIHIHFLANYDVLDRTDTTLIVGYTNIDEEKIKDGLDIIRKKIGLL